MRSLHQPARRRCRGAGAGTTRRAASRPPDPARRTAQAQAAVEAVGVGQQLACVPTWTTRPPSMTTIRSASTIGGQAVGDDERGPAAQQVRQGGLDQRLAGGVERAGGLVEDDQGRVLAEGPGDRQALAFALAELVAPLADDRRVALGQRRGEVVHQRGPGGGLDLRVARPRGRRSGCCRPGSGGRRPGPGARRRSGGGGRRWRAGGSARRRAGSRPRSGRRTAAAGSPACSCRSRSGPTRATFMPGSTRRRTSQTTGWPRLVAEADAVELDQPAGPPDRQRGSAGSASVGSRSRISPSRSTLATACSKTYARSASRATGPKSRAARRGGRDHLRRASSGPGAPPGAPTAKTSGRAHAADRPAEVRERRRRAGSPAPGGRGRRPSCAAKSAIFAGSRAYALITMRAVELLLEVAEDGVHLLADHRRWWPGSAA